MVRSEPHPRCPPDGLGLDEPVGGRAVLATIEYYTITAQTYLHCILLLLHAIVPSRLLLQQQVQHAPGAPPRLLGKALQCCGQDTTTVHVGCVGVGWVGLRWRSCRMGGRLGCRGELEAGQACTRGLGAEEETRQRLWNG